VESKVNAGLIVVMELDGVTTLLLTLAPLNLIVRKVTNVLENANGTDLLSKLNQKQSLNQLPLKA